MSVQTPLSADVRRDFARVPVGGSPVGATSSNRRGLIAIGGVLVCGCLLAVAAAHTESLLPETIRPVPPSLAGAFGDTGLNLHVGGAIAALSLMFVSYAVVVAASTRLSARAVLIAVAALHVVVLLGPPLVSTDVFSYQAYARLGSVYAFNPYLNGPHANPLDPVFVYIGSKWAYIPSVYGPVFTAFSYLLASLSIATSVFAYKSIAAVASLALVFVIWRCARLRGTDPVASTTCSAFQLNNPRIRTESLRTKVSVAGKRNFQGRDKEAETARRHFGPVTADIEPVSANRGLRFRETGFYGQR